MSHQITISDAAYSAITTLAVELGKSPETVTEEAVDALQAKIADQRTFWGEDTDNLLHQQLAVGKTRIFASTEEMDAFLNKIPFVATNKDDNANI